jgi:glycosyltransferase involved in cell wall biosynthesis
LSSVKISPVEQAEAGARSIGILSTFPPTSCGIATFSAALAAGLIATGASVDVVRCGPSPTFEDPLVLGSLTDSASIEEAVDVLNATDVAIIQHEYGIYGGLDGEQVLDVLARVEVPIIVVAHTVVIEPTMHQRRLLEKVCDAADVVIVMTRTARDRLFDGYDVDETKVMVVPHGATIPAATDALDTSRGGEAPRLLTWGLLGPGKGIEWAIDALALLDDLQPRPEYVIAGSTHPKVKEEFGEAYREMLVARVAASGLGEQVVFDDEYRDLASLMTLIRTADLVVLPYDSVDQVTSGVLVDAPPSHTQWNCWPAAPASSSPKVTPSLSQMQSDR